ncbi:hypothetical protein MRX96_023116 [Rhipicephalus microplus]
MPHESHATRQPACRLCEVTVRSSRTLAHQRQPAQLLRCRRARCATYQHTQARPQQTLQASIWLWICSRRFCHVPQWCSTATHDRSLQQPQRASMGIALLSTRPAAIQDADCTCAPAALRPPTC